MYCLILTLFLVGCGFFHSNREKDPVTPVSVTALREMFADKKAEYEAKSAKGHWPTRDDCDATLWAGLVCGAGVDVSIEEAEYPSPGVIHRRPDKACYTADGKTHDSASTVSNDMFVGYLWCGWRSKKLEAMQRVANYGGTHDWVMGIPFPAEAARVVLRPNGQILLDQIIFNLSNGADARATRLLPTVHLPVSADYEHHLETLGILLGGETTPLAQESGLLDISDQGLARLKENAAANPDDALFQAALGVYTGDFTIAVRLLLDPAYVSPSYVRGAELYPLVHWLFAADVVLRRYPSP